MEVNTKFNLDELCWYITNNKVTEVRIKGYQINVDENSNVEIVYNVMYDDNYVPENKLFKTKEELLKTL